jgi:ABC-type antimicrobial peptide transport system permease subunit
VVVSQELEQRLFGGDAVGRRLQGAQTSYEVVGVVSDVRQQGYSDDNLAVVYRLLRGARATHILVRTAGDVGGALPSIRQTIEGHDTPMFVTSIAPLEAIVGDTIAIERSRAMLSGAYGLVALLLAAVGLYGLAARLAAECRREIGIRVALGAGRRHIRRLVMADAWIIIAIGVVVGAPAAVVLSGLAEGLLYGVAPAAPHVLVTAALALAVAALVATVVPAARANRVDPAVTLRDE